MRSKVTRDGMLAAALLALVAPRAAAAQDDYYDREDDSGVMSFRVDNPRPVRSWIVVGSMAGATLLTFGAGALFRWSGNNQADKVEAKERTGLIWDAERQDIYDSARFRRGTAYVLFGLAGGMTIATIATFLATDPGYKTVRVGTSQEDIGARLQIVPGGAVVSRGWRF